MASTLLSLLVITSGVALLPLFIASIAASRRLFIYLHERHPETWRALGSPTIWGGAQSASSPAVRYFTTRKYLAVDDPQLHAMGNKARSLLYLAVATLTAFLLALLALDAVGA